MNVLTVAPTTVLLPRHARIPSVHSLAHAQMVSTALVKRAKILTSARSLQTIAIILPVVRTPTVHFLATARTVTLATGVRTTGKIIAIV